MSKNGQGLDRPKPVAGSSVAGTGVSIGSIAGQQANAGSGSPGVPRLEAFEGLFIHGRVCGRRKEPFTLKATGEVREKVTYSIDVGTGTIKVDEWSPKSYHQIEAVVSLPVNVRSFALKGGGAAYSLIVRGSDERGEEF